jgi:hypothetical protein
MTTNKDRANYAAAAVEAFQQACPTPYEAAIGDLIVDLLHLARRDYPNFDPARMTRVAAGCFLEEEMEEAMHSEDLPL